MMIEKIFIINLDERIDRWKDVTKELEESKVPFYLVERFPAIRHCPGYMGCTMSHIACLKLAKENGYKSVLILEDDFNFYREHYENFYSILEKLDHVEFDWDVIFFSANVMRQVPFNDLFHKIEDAQTSSGYLVHHNYYDTLISCLEHCLQSNHFLDIEWKQLQSQDRWFIFTKKVGYQRPSMSDIENKFVDYNC